MNNIIVRYVPLPASVKGFVKEDAAGDYNVYIREQDPTPVQQETYRHELAHIRGYHLQAEAWDEDFEREAENHVKQCKENVGGKLAGTSLRLHGRKREEARPKLYGPDESASRT